MNSNKVIISKNSYNQIEAISLDGIDRTTEIPRERLREAFNKNKGLEKKITASGAIQWWLIDIEENLIMDSSDPIETSLEQSDAISFIHSSVSLRPSNLVISDLKWKYLIRSAMRGRNIMMTGQAGCGKTMSAKALTNVLDRPDFYFNMGATQDPRGTLIGNTHYKDGEGTYFNESLFVKAIQTENAVILLDELTRAHPDAWNILMPVLDYGQRYLRLDEKDGQATIKVADGVTFISTANIGNEYTATRKLDKALLDRFTIIEMDLLTNIEEFNLLKHKFPSVENSELKNISEISHLTRIESQNENPRISSGISTRTSVEIASLIYDGFNLNEAAEITIYPQYEADGGLDSERTFIKQIVQKFCDDESSEALFNDQEVNGASSK